MRSWSLGGRLAAAFTFAGVVLLLVAGLATAALTRLGTEQERVTGTFFATIRGSTDLFNAYLDEETSVRGYALTGDPRFLQPYEEALRDQDRISRQLDAAVGPDPSLRSGLDALLRAGRAWQEDFAEPTIAAVDAGGPRAVRAPQVDTGRRLFETVRREYGDYSRELLTERAAAVEDLERARLLLLWVGIIGVVLLGLSAVLLAVALRRWVVGPMERLGAEVRAVAAGDLSHRVAVDGPPEVVRLAYDVDVMRSQILSAYQEAVAARVTVEQQRHELEEQAADLQRSNAELEQFAYVASHDLQEPLRKISSFTQMLQRRYEGQLDERADQYIEFAVDGAKRMQRLINDLLAFSRVGRLTTGFTDVSCERALDSALRNLAERIEETAAEVTADPLPTVRGEAVLIAQVFQNLVGNALKFARPDAPPRVHVGCERTGDEWEFAVADNGIGIDPQYAERIFVIFQRLHRKEEYSGTGIGLALCRKIVEYHGGRIWLDTAVSSGTTIRFTLPTLEAASPGADTREEPGAA